jgi:hypothetical protein
MGRGSGTPSPFGQMGTRPPIPNFDAGQFRDRIDQFRSSHPFPASPGFPFPGGVPGGTPPISPPPSGPTDDNEGTFPGGGHTGGVFPGGGATGGAFPGGAGANPRPPRNFPQGAGGNTMGRVGGGWGPISGRPETLDRSFSPTGSRMVRKPARRLAPELFRRYIAPTRKASRYW